MYPSHSIYKRKQMPFASAQDRQVAEKVINTLLSEKYKGKNYLFLEPFDINDVPGYLESVGKPLDLRTISERFQNDGYDGPAFWSDLTNVYQNAIKYHGDKQQSKWIAKYAKDMLKVVNRERKNAENPTEKSIKSTTESTGSGSADTSLSAATPTKKQKTKLKLQLPTAATAAHSAKPLQPPPPPPPLLSSSVQPPLSSSSSSTSGIATAATAKRPKLKIRLTGKAMPEPITETAPVAAVAASAVAPVVPTAETKTKIVAKKAKSLQPKLKLTLSLKKTKSESSLGGLVKPVKKKKKVVVVAAEEEGEVEEGEVKQTTLSNSSSSDKKSVSSSTSSKSKVVVAVGPSRGKELPQGVIAAAPSLAPPAAAVTKPKKNKKLGTATKKIAATPTTATPAITTTAAAVAGGGGGSVVVSTTQQQQPQQPRLELQQTRQCYKVIAGLKRRKNKQISWFLTPVSDKNILPDYRSKIKQPMDLQSIQAKLDKGLYKKVEAFCLDVRRVFANALRYNTSIKDSLRPLAVEVLQTAEALLLMFIARHYPQSYTPLLYCWKVCIDIMDTLYNLVNPNDGQPMAYYFLHPVSVYCGGKFPVDYLEKVKKPMDFGTITANLVEGRYQTVDAFASDCRLVVQNCQAYYSGKEESRVFLDQAIRLNECLTTQLTQLGRYDKSAKAASEKQKAMQQTNPTRIVQEMVLPNQPPQALFLSVVEDLLVLKYTDKGTKITEPAMSPFEKPVSLVDFPDYMQYVQEPMDLLTVERKVKLGTAYETPEDFEYDMDLIFKNCEIYNSSRNVQHSVAMAKFANRKFRGIFYAKIQAYEDPASVPPPRIPASSPQQAQQQPEGDQPSSSSPPSKKIKIDASGASSKGKIAPRISITAAQLSSAALAARAKSPVAQPKKFVGQVQLPKAKADQPVPLHIAIAKVKEAFPLRRAVKSLQSWEADCARYFKELMRHPWISAARPKFIFHVPVPTLFPELREHYAAKIRQPMDLTTIECTLLAGNRYAGPEDFIQDVALVFANAIRFNKDGKDVGDPLSCAYYDASVHLLKYSRWLSLELLSNHIDSTEHTDVPGADGLPPFAWKLTEGNRKVARLEVESIVLKEPIEKSLEGDRYTWMEAECEKLLKALRHQSDLRYMTFFIQPNYPADYTAFIAKPMDWEKVQRTLKKRHYDTLGALIDDLRLIFSNAEKYNSRLRGTDTVSGRAFEAAKYMSDKLEIAINKLLLSVSDRLERERIDHTNAEREIEAAEQAEEAEIRAAWKKGESDKEGASPTPSRSEFLQKTRIVRRAPQRRQATDFEIPFFDEDDDGQHERSYFEVVKFQKAMFEKQRQDLLKMRKVTASIGASVLTRLLQRDIADEEWKQRAALLPKASTLSKGKASISDEESNLVFNKPSSVLSELEQEGRQMLKIKVTTSNQKIRTAKRKQHLQGFD